jgi:hypothetical protein
MKRSTYLAIMAIAVTLPNILSASLAREDEKEAKLVCRNSLTQEYMADFPKFYEGQCVKYKNKLGNCAIAADERAKMKACENSGLSWSHKKTITFGAASSDSSEFSATINTISCWGANVIGDEYSVSRTDGLLTFSEPDKPKSSKWLVNLDTLISGYRGYPEYKCLPEDTYSKKWFAKLVQKPIQFSSVQAKPDDVAVIIGNFNYKREGKDIPDVAPAYADAEGIKQWLIQAKGIREGNIIFLKDATGSQMVSVFGNERSHKGQLFNWTKPNISNVYVYYAGHGAPAGDNSSAFLVPTDSNSATIELTGYPLATLYKNLNKLPAKSITVILESCFSGTSQNGNVISRTSGILITPKVPSAPKNITVISAGRANQIASWEQDDSHSLFTKYFLKGMSGEADVAPYGDGDGKVNYDELGKYLEGTMTYYARRYYGRDQNAQIVQRVQ